MIYRLEIRMDIDAADRNSLDLQIDRAASALREAGFDPEVSEILDEHWNEV